jgi:hypothetical protein
MLIFGKVLYESGKDIECDSLSGKLGFCMAACRAGRRCAMD